MLSLKEDDVTKMLAAETHLGETNGPDFQMAQYVFKVKSDGEGLTDSDVLLATVFLFCFCTRYCYYKLKEDMGENSFSG